MGLQGSLLALLIDDPIYIDEIVVGKYVDHSLLPNLILIEINLFKLPIWWVCIAKSSSWTKLRIEVTVR